MSTQQTNENASAAADKPAHREPAMHEYLEDRTYRLRLNHVGESAVVEAMGEVVQCDNEGALVCLTTDRGQIRRLSPRSYHTVVKFGPSTYELRDELHTGEILNYVGRKCDFDVTNHNVTVKRWTLQAETEKVN